MSDVASANKRTFWKTGHIKTVSLKNKFIYGFSLSEITSRQYGPGPKQGAHV